MFSITISFFKDIRIQFLKYYYSLTEKIRKIYITAFNYIIIENEQSINIKTNNIL